MPQLSTSAELLLCYLIIFVAGVAATFLLPLLSAL